MHKVRILFLICIFSLSAISIGCQPKKDPVKHTYSKETIANDIVELCKREYKREPKVWLVNDTVWVYTSFESLIDKNMEPTKEVSDTLNDIVLASSRVALSMNPRPKFLVIAASDIKEYGIDYITISYIPDLVKYRLDAISRDEFLKRHVTRIKENSEAMSDTEGKHLEKTDINLQDFMAEQMAYRINSKFAEDPILKDHSKINKVSVRFKDEAFEVVADIQQVTQPKAPVDIQGELAKIVSSVVKAYNFNDFALAQIENVATGEKTVLSSRRLKESPN